MNYYPGASKIRAICRDGLWGIHLDVSSKRHAIEYTNGSVDWREYNPTHFMYVYFTFNSLYSIDWITSLNKGKLCYHGELSNLCDNNFHISESKQFYKMINVCFRNNYFVRKYYPILRIIVLYKQDSTKISEVLDSLCTKNDSSISEEVTDKFKGVVKKIVDNKPINNYDVGDLAFFIYKVRCNIFHGAKNLRDMNNIDQKKRLKLYTNILIAINQMIFSYLDYICGEDDQYEYLFDIMKIQERC